MMSMKRLLILILFPLFVCGQQVVSAQASVDPLVEAISEKAVIVDSIENILISNGILTQDE